MRTALALVAMLVAFPASAAPAGWNLHMDFYVGLDYWLYFRTSSTPDHSSIVRQSTATKPDWATEFTFERSGLTGRGDGGVYSFETTELTDRSGDVQSFTMVARSSDQIASLEATVSVSQNGKSHHLEIVGENAFGEPVSGTVDYEKGKLKSRMVSGPPGKESVITRNLSCAGTRCLGTLKFVIPGAAPLAIAGKGKVDGALALKEFEHDPLGLFIAHVFFWGNLF